MCVIIYSTDDRRIVTERFRENSEPKNNTRNNIVVVVVIIIIRMTSLLASTVRVRTVRVANDEWRRLRLVGGGVVAPPPPPSLLKIVRAAAVHSWCGCGKPVARRRGQEAFARRPAGRGGPARTCTSTPRTRPPPFSLMGTPTRAPQVRAHTHDR